MTVPLLVIAALVIVNVSADPSASPSSSGPLPPVSVAAPPSSAALETPCALELEQLPRTLAGLAPRIVRSVPSSPFIVGWGDPAIVLRCGVPRPAGLKPGAQVIAVDHVNVLARKESDATVFTVVDRSVYIDVTVPSSYSQPPLGPIALATAKALKPVCTMSSAESDLSKVCTHRR